MSRRAVVVGGGITGLTAAHLLTQRGWEVTVLEADERLGGKLRTEELAGQRLDVGADSFLIREPHAVDLARSLGLGEDLRHPGASEVWLAIGGRLRRLPEGTVFGVPTDLVALARARVLSPTGFARAASEPLRPRSEPLRHDRCVGGIVAERFGNEVVDRLVEPLLGGVYAGDAYALSVQATMPLLADAAGEEGSLLRNLAARRPERAGAPIFATVTGGLERLVHALVERLGDVRAGVAVTALGRGASGWRVTTRGPDHGDAEVDADVVVVTTPAPVTARLLTPVSPGAARELEALRYASVAVVTLVYPQAATLRVPAGSGMLVPRSQGGLVKAATWTSQKWPHLAEDGRFVVRASVGRIGEPPPDVPDEVLAWEVASDLTQHMGLSGAPEAWLVTRWPGSMPQYDVGHADRVRWIRAALTRDAPGIHVAGAAYDGVGISHCIRQAHEVVDRIAADRQA